MVTAPGETALANPSMTVAMAGSDDDHSSVPEEPPVTVAVNWTVAPIWTRRVRSGATATVTDPGAVVPPPPQASRSRTPRTRERARPSTLVG